MLNRQKRKPFRTLIFLLIASASGNTVFGQGTVHGNVQIDAQYYRTDSTIGAFQPEDQMRMNAFANVLYTNGKFTAGVRYEAYLNALLGFLPGYTGTGFPYRFVQFADDQIDITAGSFYEQFGSGMIFRAYEERLLGVDNAMDGMRVKFTPHRGILLRGVYGKQRLFFDRGPGIVRGVDGEINLNETFDSTALGKLKTKFILGGSFVSKYQDPTSTQYVLPANVGSWGGRLNIIRGGFNFYTEYVYKINDPSKDNGFIYKPGQGFLTQISYGKKGLGVTLGAKYIDNMSFRSDRNENLTNLQINYLPSLTRPHTYNLAATLYPYATQPNGEFGAQAEIAYKIKPGAPLGGEYGTSFTLNASIARSIDTTRLNDDTSARLGYKAPFFSMGDSLFFIDINLEIKKKWNKKFTSIITVMYLFYDLALIQGHIGEEPVKCNIFVADLNYKFNRKHNLRMELQYLYMHKSDSTGAVPHQRDRGDWVTVLAEYTISPHWFIAALEQYNIGNLDAKQKVHYPYFTFGYIRDATRVSFGFGRQRAGLFCVGGVCRPVPASNGFTISITSSF